MKQIHTIRAFICGIFIIGFVNCYEYGDDRDILNGFRRLYNDHSGSFGLWPFTQPFFPVASRRVIDDDITEGPLDIDSISGSIGKLDDVHAKFGETHEPDEFGPITPTKTQITTHQLADPFSAGLFFHQSFNPFSNPFITNPFGIIDTSLPRQQQWWRGSNVCIQRKEDVEDFDGTDGINIHLSMNSCSERSHKHVCKSVFNENGQKTTLSVTHQCCHGYGRLRNTDVYEPCRKLNLQPIMEASEKLGAKEFIKAAKNNGLEDMLTKTNVTLFLPTDASFTEFSEQMLESNIVVLPMARRRRRNSEHDYLPGFTSKDLALNHIVEDWIDINDIKNDQILQTKFDNLTIRLNIFPRPPNDESHEFEWFRYTANCAPLIKVNQMADNGFVHMIDRVLTPVNKNLMELVRERSDMTVMAAVLEKTNLAELLAKDTKHFTLFAPNDKAFGELDSHLKRAIEMGNECAMNIIKNHILDISFCSIAVVNGVRTGVDNSFGTRLSLERADVVTEGANENEIADLTGVKTIKPIVINGKAKIVETDIVGTNGILHVIDAVLPFDAGLPVTSILDSRNLTIFGELIEVGGFTNEFEEMKNVSFFVPKDDAFDGNKWANLLKENPDSLKGNEELKSFLYYHIAKPLTKTCDLSEEIIETGNGNGLRINLYSTKSVLSNVMNVATANCARLVHFDDISCGSVVHQVDRILTPPSMSLLEVLEANENYSMFLELVKKSNLTHLLDDAKQNLTILVPTNYIFRELKEFYDELFENRNQLEHLIRLHILDDVLCCAGIVNIKWPFMRVVKSINDYELRISRDVRPKIQNAGITKCDIIAKNGIILEVNDIISVKRKESQIEDFNSFLNI